jgi:ribosomal protein L37AE/L43A
MIELFEVTCVYCGRSESIKQKQLGELWRCPSCAAEMNLGGRALPVAD